MRVFGSAAEVLTAAGSELGNSEWLTVTQERVDQFAEATGDHQWIHTDVERAKSESPYGGTIAHGFLSLSLIPMLGAQIYRFEGVKMAINYGSNKVRYPSPVLVGSKVRLTTTLAEATDLGDGAIQVVFGHTLAVEGTVKPAVVAEMVVRVVF
jgi:acyl dehydratase